MRRSDALAKQVCVEGNDKIARSPTCCPAERNVRQSGLQLCLRELRFHNQDTELGEMPACMVHPLVVHGQGGSLQRHTGGSIGTDIVRRRWLRRCLLYITIVVILGGAYLATYTTTEIFIGSFKGSRLHNSALSDEESEGSMFRTSIVQEGEMGWGCVWGWAEVGWVAWHRPGGHKTPKRTSQG